MKQEEHERRLKEQEPDEEISPVEQMRRQQESDLKLALETTFGSSDQPTSAADSTLPGTREEFQEFENALLKKIQPITKSEEYPAFVESFIRNVCASRKYTPTFLCAANNAGGFSELFRYEKDKEHYR